MSKIEWTEMTWNPVVGCTRVSPGCENCYAERQAFRNEAMGIKQYQGITKKVDDKIRWTGKIGFAEHLLDKPLRRKKPTTYFVNSMSDLFHKDVPSEYVDKVFAVMALSKRHTFQVLTKRPERMVEYIQLRTRTGANFYKECRLILDDRPQLRGWDPAFFPFAWPLKNVWLGTSVENAETMHRIDTLRTVPAAVRFLSLEPLLGPLPDLNLEGIDWVIVGGESGPGARPMHPHWVRDIRDACAHAQVPFFFKQWGNWGPPVEGAEYNTAYGRSHSPHAFLVDTDGTCHCFYPKDDDAMRTEECRCQPMLEVGKKAAGRTLDGKIWDQMPGR